jgi:hypothetical protein
MIEISPKRNVKKQGGEVIDWVIKIVAKDNVLERGWKVIHRLIKHIPEI